MSVHEDIESVENTPRPSRGVNPRVAVAIAGLILIIIFAAVNAQTVRVDFVVDSFEVPLVLVILAAAILGGVVDRLLVVQKRRRASR